MGRLVGRPGLYLCCLGGRTSRMAGWDEKRETWDGPLLGPWIMGYGRMDGWTDGRHDGVSERDGLVNGRLERADGNETSWPSRDVLLHEEHEVYDRGLRRCCFCRTNYTLVARL